MHIAYLKLRNFRNYQELELTFSPRVNVFWGFNGQGKTNLLEAIRMLSTGRSFRTHRLEDMVREGADHFYIEAKIYKDGVLQSLKVYFGKTCKKVLFNETAYPYFSSLLGILPSVLLSPDDLELINGSPAERRRFLDLHIAQIDPLYLFYLSRYYKAMKQRNELLRSQAVETLPAWEQMMASAGSYLIAKRRQATISLQASSQQWMQFFSKGEELKLSYTSTLNGVKEEELQGKLSHQWQNARHKDMHYGSTQIGPHRDDLAILLFGKEAKHFSSEGQKRSLLASLRFAEWEHMQNRIQDAPLLAIDDFGIQLDETRARQLKEQIAHFGQVFLTSPQEISPLRSDIDFQAFHIDAGRAITSGVRAGIHG